MGPTRTRGTGTVRLFYLPMHLELTRFARARQTLGLLRLYDEGDQVWWCCALERPWIDNENNQSCIPPAPNKGPASYHVDHRDPPEYSAFQYPHFIVREVPGRTAILFHRGNFVSDSEGCVLVGRSFTDINGDRMTDVTSSTETLREMVDHVPEEGAELTVRWAEIADMERMVADDPELDLEKVVAEVQLADRSAVNDSSQQLA